MFDVLAMCFKQQIPINKIPTGLRQYYNQKYLAERIGQIYSKSVENLIAPKTVSTDLTKQNFFDSKVDFKRVILNKDQIWAFISAGDVFHD